MDVIEFGQFDFTVPSSEQAISIHRARKEIFKEDLENFYIAFLGKEFPSKEEQEYKDSEFKIFSLKESMSLDNTKKILYEDISMLNKKYELDFIDSIENVYKIFEDWNLHRFLILTKDEFIVFTWRTTA